VLRNHRQGKGGGGGDGWGEEEVYNALVSRDDSLAFHGVSSEKRLFFVRRCTGRC